MNDMRKLLDTVQPLFESYTAKDQIYDRFNDLSDHRDNPEVNAYLVKADRCWQEGDGQGCMDALAAGEALVAGTNKAAGPDKDDTKREERNEKRRNVEHNNENLDEGYKAEIAAFLTALSVLGGTYGMKDQAQQFADQLQKNIHAAQNAEPSLGQADPISDHAFTAGPDRIMRPKLEALRKLAGVISEADTDDQTEKTAVGHLDDERNMLKKTTYQMGKYCVELYKLLDGLPDNADLPHWWQSKLVKADDYISGAKHYLENEINVPEHDTAHQDPSQDDDFDPSGVS